MINKNAPERFRRIFYIFYIHLFYSITASHKLAITSEATAPAV